MIIIADTVVIVIVIAMVVGHMIIPGCIYIHFYAGDGAA